MNQSQPVRQNGIRTCQGNTRRLHTRLCIDIWIAPIKNYKQLDEPVGKGGAVKAHRHEVSVLSGTFILLQTKVVHWYLKVLTFLKCMNTLDKKLYTMLRLWKHL